MNDRAARRLKACFDRLDDPGRETLLAFAEFLVERLPAASAACPREPLAIPRPQEESVIAALRRLRRSYPMLDEARLLDGAARAMTRHVLQGVDAAAVIDELETLFEACWRRQEEELERP